MTRHVWGLMAAALLGASTAQGGTLPRGDTIPADYSRPAAWLCRPGVDDGTCSAGVDAIAVDAGGKRTPAPYIAAKAPAIDCFYVYPTGSNDPAMYSDMIAGKEERIATRAQVGPLGALCRQFVPIHHQFTATGFRWLQAHGRKLGPEAWDPPYAGIKAAWRSYLARDNHGRGIVLIGHSQGAMLLTRLIAEEIDGKPAQKLLVAAYLAGNVDLATDRFRAIPPCARAAQAGCVVAWSTYYDGKTAGHYFGAVPAGKTALCVNPASLGGGRGLLKAFLSKPDRAPAGDPPNVEAIGQLSAECVGDATGSVLAIRAEPGPNAVPLRAAFENGISIPGWPAIPGWGLHIMDINLVMGNLLDLIPAQAAAWSARR